VAGTLTRRRYADRFEADHHRHSGNRDHQSDPHVAESPMYDHSAPDSNQ
jgi:hypothetical protein